MDLRRAGGEPDWANVPAHGRNVWQKLAAASRGFVTPGNFFSVLGLLSVPLAVYVIVAHDAYLLGTALLIIGRLFDLVDGWLANATGTKGPLGEKVDASFDKFSTGILLIAGAIYGLLPWWVAVLVAVPHLVISVLALGAYRKGFVLHPSRLGKLSMAAAWFSLLAFVVIPAFGDPWQAIVRIIAYALLVGSVAMGAASVVGYAREYHGTIRQA